MKNRKLQRRCKGSNLAGTWCMYCRHQCAQPAVAITIYKVKWPMHYLLKTEPSEYSFEQLRKDKTTVWDGVTNPQAVKHLREMKPGDDLIIYHTGDERRAVGTASVVSVDVSDPKTPKVKIKAGRELATAMSLAEIKANKAFHASPLVKQGRLSVVPLSEAQYRIVAGD